MIQKRLVDDKVTREELKVLVPTAPEPPALEHFNVNQDHVTVIKTKSEK